MLLSPFFPGPAFGWLFALAVAGLLAACSWVDFRRLRIPKPLTLGLVALGVLLNVARGAMLGATGANVWQFGPAGAFGGATDGFLFALAGFVVGFGLFFAQWVIGLCGGGDVKLAAGLGACLGPSLFFVAFVFSLPVTMLLVIGKSVIRMAKGERVAHHLRAEERDTDAGRRKRRVQSYSFPLAAGAMLAMLALLGPELGLLAKPAPPAAPKAAE